MRQHVSDTDWTNDSKINVLSIGKDACEFRNGPQASRGEEAQSRSARSKKNDTDTLGRFFPSQVLCHSGVSVCSELL